VWNVDESGLTTIHTLRNTITRKSAEQVRKMTSGEKGKTVTTVSCMSVGDSPGKNMMDSCCLMNEHQAPSGAQCWAVFDVITRN